jgi:hypothetical protein
MRALCSLTALTSLDLAGRVVEEEDSYDLHLSECDQVSDDGLRTLATSLTALTSLTLSNCRQVSTNGRWRALCSPTALRHINLKRTDRGSDYDNSSEYTSSEDASSEDDARSEYVSSEYRSSDES